MRKFKILLFAILTACNILSAAGNDNSTNALRSEPEDKGCNLPAPNNLAVTNVTSNTITVQWDSVPGAIGYRVAAFEPGTNNQFPTLLSFSSPTTATIGGLPPGTPVEIHVSGKCAGGEESPNYSAVITATDVVIEIVANGFNCNNTPNYGQAQSLTSPVNYVVLLGSDAPVYKFRVTKNVPNSPEYLFEMRITNRARFHLSSAGNFSTNQNVGSFSTAAGSQTIFTFRVTSPSTTSAVLQISPGPESAGYSIQMSQPLCGNFGAGLYDPNENKVPDELSIQEDRSLEQPESSIDNTTISPVPFDDHLTIMFGGGDIVSTDVNIQLFTINGALKESRTVTANAGNNVVELNTSALQPGLYIVQVKTAQGAVTKLVTKTGQ